MANLLILQKKLNTNICKTKYNLIGNIKATINDVIRIITSHKNKLIELFGDTDNNSYFTYDNYNNITDSEKNTLIEEFNSKKNILAISVNNTFDELKKIFNIKLNNQFSLGIPIIKYTSETLLNTSNISYHTDKSNNIYVNNNIIKLPKIIIPYIYIDINEKILCISSGDNVGIPDFTSLNSVIYPFGNSNDLDLDTIIENGKNNYNYIGSFYNSEINKMNGINERFNKLLATCNDTEKKFIDLCNRYNIIYN